MVPADAHGCPACPHTGIGPAVAGSPNVLVNGLPAIRVDDPGIHAACCGPNKWNAKTGSRAVLINGRSAHRLADLVVHCGGIGRTIEGSHNVIVGDQTSAHARLQNNPKKKARFVIIDDEGKPVPDIRVSLTAPDGSVQMVVTDQTGRIHISDAQPGIYHIEISADDIIIDDIGNMTDIKA